MNIAISQESKVSQSGLANLPIFSDDAVNETKGKTAKESCKESTT
jgi:hypothetical protein